MSHPESKKDLATLFTFGFYPIGDEWAKIEQCFIFWKLLDNRNRNNMKRKEQALASFLNRQQ